jgi:hypothetical protein
MKYAGRVIKGPRIKVVPIIRSKDEGGNIYFQIRSVTDYTPFSKICPQPTQPMLKAPGGKEVPDTKNQFYNAQMAEWSKKQADWVFLVAMSATKELEWETVDMANPDTYKNWEIELLDGGFSQMEINLITNAIMEVNGVNEAMIEEARQHFLTTQVGANAELYSPPDDPKNMPSGKPVSESASVPQA